MIGEAVDNPIYRSVV